MWPWPPNFEEKREFDVGGGIIIPDPTFKDALYVSIYAGQSVTSSNDNSDKELSVKHHLFDPNNNTPPNPWLKKLSERIDRYDNKTLST